ncbi:MAG: hypothetical protein ABSH30_14855 [Acidimicrobiales bacterium]
MKRCFGAFGVALAWALGPGALAAGAGSSPAWVVQPTPNPASAHGPHAGSLLASVSCPSTSSCTAVGNTNRGTVLAEHWNGTSWSIQSTPDPAGSTDIALQSVSCPSTTICMAVGSYWTSAAVPATLAELWDGTTWKIQPTPNPSGRHWPNPELSGVSCPSTTECVAVGSYLDSNSVLQTLVERWNGATWGIEDAPNPPNPDFGGGSVLGSVSCPSTTACTAVGSSGSRPPVSKTLAERWNGKLWAIEPTATAGGATWSVLESVSCVSTSECTASGVDGYASGSSTLEATLIERWAGTWGVQDTPNPVDNGGSLLFGVSCPASLDCTAVGRDSLRTGGSITLAEHWNGRTWAIQSTPSPGGSPGLSAVSCPSTSTCTAVGSYGKIVPQVKATLAEHI